MYDRLALRLSTFAIVEVLAIIVFTWTSGQAGKGCVYTYDAVGSYERSGYSSQGSGMQLIMPVLDNQLKSASPLVLPLKVSVTNLWLMVWTPPIFVIPRPF